MHQLDTNRFSTFGNEMDHSAHMSSHRNQKPSSFRNASYENHHNQGDGLDGNMRRSQRERFSLDEDHHDEEEPRNSLEYLEENQGLGAPKQLQGVERSLENTGKTALSKASGSDANDLRNTLSLFFPCDYYVPESFGSTAMDNKTILEVTETEREKENAKDYSKGGSVAYPMSRREAEMKSNRDIYDKSIETLRDLNRISNRDGGASDRIVSLDRNSERTKMTDDSGKGRSSSCEKSYLINEFKSLRKEVVAIQKDFKMSENYNRKLEGHIYNQNNQILQILQNFTSLKEENGTLKTQLHGMIPKKPTSQPKETERRSKIDMKDHANIDHAVAKKANKFYKDEIVFLKSKYEKIIKNHECIIKDLQNQLKMRDMELEEAKRLNEREIKKLEESLNYHPQNRLAAEDSHSHKARSDNISHRDVESTKFYTPSRSKPLAEINASNSYERVFENSKSTRSFVEGASVSSYNHPKHAMNLLKDLQKPKEQDKENLHSRPSEKKVSASKSSSNFQLHSLPHNRVSDNHQSYLQKPLLKQSQSQRDQMREVAPLPEHEDDTKKSLIDISFDASYMDKRLGSELTSLNISPAKEHDWKSMKPYNLSKSRKPIQNISQFNEISIIKEQPSENFITDSIQTKIFTELQSQSDSNKRCTTEEREINVYKLSLKEGRGYSENREEKRKSRIQPEEYYNNRPSIAANPPKIKEYYDRPKSKAENSYHHHTADQGQQNYRKKSSRTKERHPLENNIKSERVHHILQTRQLPGDPFEYESGEAHQEANLRKQFYPSEKSLLKRSQNRSNEFDSQLDIKKLDRYTSLQNQNNNDTIINLNNALEEMLENDQLRISHQKHKSKRDDLGHKRKDPEVEKLKMQSRSKSSGHSRKKSGGSSNLQLGAVNHSSKGILSNRAEALNSSSHREYDDAFEGDGLAQSKGKQSSSSRRNLYNPYDQIDHNPYMRDVIQDPLYLKSKREVSSHSSQRSTTPTNSQYPQHRAPISNKYRSDSSMYSQTPVDKENKKLYKPSGSEGVNSFEGPAGREYLQRLQEKENFKKDSKYAYEYQPQVNDKNRNKPDSKRQPSIINDSVNFDSVIHHDRDMNGGIINQSSFALFQEKYSHTNFDSINSSTLFEAFPIRKSQAHKEGDFQIGNLMNNIKPKYF